MGTITKVFLACICLTLTGTRIDSASADVPFFSGPQAGEKITPFRIVDVAGSSAGKTRDIPFEKGPAAIVLVFVHGVERSIVPLLTTIDQYGFEKRDGLKTEIVFLSDDRAASEKHLPLVGQSLHLQCPMTLSVDGLEGPGNYGLNKSCLMTIVIARERRVTANFALAQPGAADAPAVIREMARACGDADPPTADVLRARRAKAMGGNSGPGPTTRTADRAGQTGPKTELPGATPTDAKLLALLRSFIQKSNDDQTVDRIARDVEAYVKDNPDLTLQAVGGWTRVVYLKYGTDYARATGQKLVERLKK